jgi:hypothetical protein
MADSAIGMEREDLKRLLLRSKKEPVNCAVAASTEDKTVALILLDKVKAPKAVSVILDKQHPKNTSLRWGTASVDTDDDPKLVVFKLHKNVMGMAKKLKKSLKGTGFTKVRIEFEDGTPAEVELEEDAAATLPPVTRATENEQVEREEEAPSSPDPVAAATYAKAGQIWVATRAKVQSEVDRLKAEILKAYSDNPARGEIEAAFTTKVKPALDALDTALSEKLAEVATAADGAARAKLTAEAREIMARYAGFTASEALIKDLDANPFAPLAIQATILNTVKALSTTVR